MCLDVFENIFHRHVGIDEQRFFVLNVTGEIQTDSAEYFRKLSGLNALRLNGFL